MKTCALKCSLLLFLLMVCFRLEASPWTSPPDTLTGTGVSKTTVATNATGVSVAAWVDSDGRISTSIRPAGVNGSWGSASQVSTSGKTVTGPVVAINDNGDAIVIWENSTDVTIEASFRPVGTGVWSSATVISSASSKVDTQKVAMNNSLAVGVWRHENGGGDKKIETNTFNISTQSWGTEEFLSDAGAGSPDVTVGSDSTTAVIWRVQRTKLEIEANIREPGESWSSASIMQLSAESQDAANPAIGINALGSPVAIWSYQFDGTNYVIQGACWTGSSWSTPVNLSGTLASVSKVRLAVNGNGDAAAVWSATTASQPLHLIYAAFLKSLSGNSWTAETVVSRSTIETEKPEVGVDALGNAIVIWNEIVANGTNEIIQSRFYLHSGSTWAPSEIVAVSASGQKGGEPALGVGSGGSATAVWEVGSGGAKFEEAAYFAVAYPPINVTAKRNSDRFFGQKDLYNKLRGNNHPSNSPVTYTVYRADGTTQVETVGASKGLKFEEHNRRKGIFETYQVVTNNSNGGQSFPYSYTVTK